MRFGIPVKSMNLIFGVLRQREEVKKAAMFGSRGMGDYKKGSDVDIAIYGTAITAEIVNQLSVELNEKLPLPYYFDIVHYESLKHKKLKEHIDRHGEAFYGDN